jgi:hypothetical protein
MIKRARARARRNQNLSSRASQAAEDSGTEFQSEAGRSLPDRSRNKGKSVQQPSQADQEDEGAETETESNVAARSEAGENGKH